MRKAIIISGPPASGKSYTSNAISQLYDRDRVCFVLIQGISNIDKMYLYGADLCVIKDCESFADIKKFEKVRRKFYACNFIFEMMAFCEVKVPASHDSGYTHINLDRPQFVTATKKTKT